MKQKVVLNSGVWRPAPSPHALRGLARAVGGVFGLASELMVLASLLLSLLRTDWPHECFLTDSYCWTT